MRIGRAARRPAAVGAALLLALAPSACGGGSDEGKSAATVLSDSAQTLPSQPGDSGQTSASAAEDGATTLSATLADFSIALDRDSIPAGAYEIAVVNEGKATHDLVVELDGETLGAVDPLDPGRSATLSVTLGPGDHVLYCSIGNHRAMGMETTLEVT